MTIYKQTQEDIIKLLRGMTGKYNLYALWRDFLTIAACTISNSVDQSQWEVREKLYMKTIEKYNKDELNTFAKMIALIATGFESGVFGDYLGEVYMQLEIANKDVGQFFTPYHVSQLSAEMVGADIQEDVISLHEPSCGSGGMIVAHAEVLRKQGINYQEKLRVVCNDLDYDVVKMAYIQLSILGIDAVIMQGDTLTKEMGEVWYTPMHFINVQRDKERVKDEKWRRMINMVRELENKGTTVVPLKKPVVDIKEDSTFMFYFL